MSACKVSNLPLICFHCSCKTAIVAARMGLQVHQARLWLLLLLLWGANLASLRRIHTTSAGAAQVSC